MSYIKLNNNPNHLSLGNLFQEIKNNSINKSSAIQTEIFCIIFNIEDISDKTVNNYCTGYRSIGNDYKQIYISLRKKYNSNKKIFIDIINNLITIMSGMVCSYIDIEDINNDIYIKRLVLAMHPYVKNDQYINNSYKKEYLSLLNDNNYYECIIKILFFTILEKKQPIYDKDIVNTTINDILLSTNISVEHLKEYLEIKFKEGISYIFSLKKLKHNPYALNELGNLYYLGYITGSSDYELAFNYHLKAANYNHPTSTWMISHMLLNKEIGSLSDDDINMMWEYLNKAYLLKSISSVNTLGICYLRGINPDREIDIDKAITYFEEAISYNYIYAYNNLGKIYEDKLDYDKAFNLYIESANMEESWACNKIGEFYRLGLGTDKDLRKAYEYYTLGLESPSKNLCEWNIINLVKYFYKSGSSVIGIRKNINKAILLLNKINYFNEAQILLLYLYYERYLEGYSNDDLVKVKYYLNLLNNNPNIDIKKREEINNTISSLACTISIK